MKANLGYIFFRCIYRAAPNNTGHLLEKRTVDTVRIKELFNPVDHSSALDSACTPYVSAPVAPPVPQAPVVKKNDQRSKGQQIYRGFAALQGLLMDNQPKETDNDARERNHISTFTLSVLYPGLYSGLGYAHGLPQNAQDIAVGFSFDYTTGLPYIPGSSLKGTLRSRFKDAPADVIDLFKKQKIDLSLEQLKALEIEIFGYQKPENEPEREDGQPGKVIFYDVFPITKKENKTSVLLLGKDNITPHKNPLASPKLVNTIRMLPNVDLRFYFSFPQTIAVDGKEIAAKELTAVFKTLLKDWGIGAKTNAGYGALK